MENRPALRRQPPLESRDTEIDLIEREMEGGVVVVQTPSVYEDDVRGSARRVYGVSSRRSGEEPNN